MASSQEFSKQINEQMRAGRGVIVDGYFVPEEHKAINAWIRKEAARNTFETTLDGQVTHVNGSPIQES